MTSGGREKLKDVLNPDLIKAVRYVDQYGVEWACVGLEFGVRKPNTNRTCKFRVEPNPFRGVKAPLSRIYYINELATLLLVPSLQRSKFRVLHLQQGFCSTIDAPRQSGTEFSTLVLIPHLMRA